MSQLLHLQLRSSSTSSHAFATGTWNNINRHWGSYVKFCTYFKLFPLPLVVSNVTCFLQLYSESVSSVNTVSNVFSSLKTMSKVNGYIPSDILLFNIKLFLLGLRRTMGTSVNQKLPITPQLLSHLYACVDFSNSFHVCMLAAMLFLFLTLFRKSNVLPISTNAFDASKQVSRQSIVCHDHFLLVSVNWSKTIQFKQKTLYIPITSIHGSKLCPVRAYKLLLSMVPSPQHFPAFCYISGGKIVPLIYSVFVTQFRLWLRQIGLSHDNLYCTHSFHRRGATWAFQSGVSPSLIKCQGDWSSDCYLQYIKLNVSDKFITTKKMADSIINLHL